MHQGRGLHQIRVEEDTHSSVVAYAGTGTPHTTPCGRLMAARAKEDMDAVLPSTTLA